MWSMSHLFAPDLPVKQRYYHIEATYKMALFDWLIHWAENAEWKSDELYHCYPFSNHRGPEPVIITLRNARKTMATLFSETNPSTVVTVLNYEISSLANTLASWRDIPAPARWETGSFFILTDLTECEWRPC